MEPYTIGQVAELRIEVGMRTIARVKSIKSIKSTSAHIERG
ncbi:hypothetical protein ABT237_24260 [Streptomyces sp. NPDC001581]